MFEEQLEILIDAIESYGEFDPYIILLYIPSSDDDEYYDFDFIFAAMSAKRMPSEKDKEQLLTSTKADIGNMVYATEMMVLEREKAIDYLSSLI